MVKHTNLSYDGFELNSLGYDALAMRALIARLLAVEVLSLSWFDSLCSIAEV